VNVAFRSRRLQRAFERRDEASRLWGPVTGRRYVERVGILMDAERVSDLHAVRPLDFHPLTGDRQGQHALRLTGQMRLVVTVEDERTVIVEEVTDYHG
jgi:proteic killer suppression protein